MLPRRLADISEMRTEERSQPLTDGSILEYIVHGEFAWKETDVNSTYGAWWMSLRTIVREVGAEAVEEKLEELRRGRSTDCLPGYPGIFISQRIIPGYGGIVATL